MRWRRWAGVAVLVAGIALIVLSVLRGLLDEDRPDGRLVIGGILLAVAIATARAAGEAATAGAEPLAHNGFKVPLVRGVGEESLLALAPS